MDKRKSPKIKVELVRWFARHVITYFGGLRLYGGTIFQPLTHMYKKVRGVVKGGKFAWFPGIAQWFGITVVPNGCYYADYRRLVFMGNGIRCYGFWHWRECTVCALRFITDEHSVVLRSILDLVWLEARLIIAISATKYLHFGKDLL